MLAIDRSRPITIRILGAVITIRSVACATAFAASAGVAIVVLYGNQVMAVVAQVADWALSRNASKPPEPRPQTTQPPAVPDATGLTNSTRNDATHGEAQTEAQRQTPLPWWHPNSRASKKAREILDKMDRPSG